MLHRLRRAMVRPDRELLHGEADETYLALSDRAEPVSGASASFFLLAPSSS